MSTQLLWEMNHTYNFLTVGSSSTLNTAVVTIKLAEVHSEAILVWSALRVGLTQCRATFLILRVPENEASCGMPGQSLLRWVRWHGLKRPRLLEAHGTC